jgi:hypothetical protein
MDTPERTCWKERFTKPHLPPETPANSAASTEAHPSRFALWMGADANARCHVNLIAHVEEQGTDEQGWSCVLLAQ